MINNEFTKFEQLRNELEFLKTLCPNQYFKVKRCRNSCKKIHVDKSCYPCIYFYSGVCKDGMNCEFAHTIRRIIAKPTPASDICRTMFNLNYCPFKQDCRYSHDLRKEPCVWHSLGKCKFTAVECRYSHEKKAEVKTQCFFNLMLGCSNPNCPNQHTVDDAYKYVSYEG